MAIDRLKLRAALRIRENYVARAMRSTEQFLLDRLAPYDQALQATRDVLRQAASAGSSVRTLRVRQHLQSLVHAVRDAVTQVLVQPTSTPSSVPDVRTLLAEFRQLDEFESVAVECRGKTLTAESEPITLEGVYLGPFAIRLRWDQLTVDVGPQCFDIEGLDPNPSAVNDDVPHPHVSNGGLCAGDATLPIRRALEEGRLADAFLLVRNVLTSYNSHSAYAPLDSWGGTDCGRCGRTVSEEQSWRCPDCEQELCADCAIDCDGCDTVHCRACLIECEECAELRCANCASSEAHGCNNESESLEAEPAVVDHVNSPPSDAG